MNISTTIIAYNEADNIADAIHSARQVSSEIIVVVDTKTTDNTAALAESLGAKVIHQEYLGDGPQKAFGVQFASNDWILSLDADERLDADAVAAIRALDLSRDSVDAYALRRKNFSGSHWVKAAGFYPDYVTRLYHKGRAAYLPKKGHSSVAANNIVKLPAHLVHFTYRDYSHWVTRINQLSSRDAWAMYERGKKPSKLAPAMHALVALLRKLILKGGIFQGVDGATVALTTAFHAYMKYLKLIELYEKKGAPQRR